MEIYRSDRLRTGRRRLREWQKLMGCLLVMMAGAALLLVRFGGLAVLTGVSIWLLLWLAAAAVMIRLDREGRLR